MIFTTKDFPLTEKQFTACMQETNKITFIVEVTLENLIMACNLDEINEYCDEVIFGDVSGVVTDIAYEVEGKIDKDTVAIKVIAHVDEC